MNIAVDMNEFNINNVFYQKPINNTVMEDSNFIRILYSDELITINGIFIKINLKIESIDAYYNKYRCAYQENLNREVINYIKNLETMILHNYKSSKKPAYKIKEQLDTMSIKIFTETNVRKVPTEFILKISGLWETTTEYGITYKFTNINRQLRNTLI